MISGQELCERGLGYDEYCELRVESLRTKAIMDERKMEQAIEADCADDAQNERDTP